jgi:phosphate starvation-inducible PhoH-like protein
MQEITLENIDLQAFYGVGNENLERLRQAHPEVKIVARGSSIKAYGEPEALEGLARVIQLLIDEIRRSGALPTRRVSEIITQHRQASSSEEASIPSTTGGSTFIPILRTVSGQAITARTEGQKRLAEAIAKHPITFAIGPAGTGKTYTAVAFAVKALKERAVRKIILTRPAVEAGESLGFLPGDLKEKIAPYLRPLYDSLEEMLSTEKLEQYLAQNVIEIAPLAYMRGRTLNDAFIILDEAQNATRLQMKMFLTRFGHNSKIVITGDLTQIDLPRPESSGLLHAVTLLERVPDIAVIRLGEGDIVRHPIVQEILRLYEEDAAARQSGPLGHRTS